MRYQTHDYNVLTQALKEFNLIQFPNQILHTSGEKLLSLSVFFLCPLSELFQPAFHSFQVQSPSEIYVLHGSSIIGLMKWPKDSVSHKFKLVAFFMKSW